MKTVCGIDLGTQSCKVVVYDYAARKTVASSSCPVEMIARNDGTREQKAEWYDAALDACFGALDAEVKETIIALGVSGHQHSLVPLDDDGKPVYNVKLWCDTSTAPECAEMTKNYGGEAKIIADFGLPMRPGYTAPKLQWLKNHESAAFSRLSHILLPHDYINFLLTGAYTAEAGDASGTALFDVRKREWARGICDAIDKKISSLLPRLVEAGGAAGTVSAAAAKRFGISEGALVAAGGGDNMMAAIGTGTVRDGVLTLSLGTSGTLFGASGRPVIDEAGNLAAFCSSSGGWLPLLCTMNCTVASEEFRGIFGFDVKSYDAEAAKAPIGSEGIVVLPFFNGERTPNLPNGRASLCGVTAANFKKENIFRATLEAAIFGMRIGLRSLEKHGFAATEIRLAGGGAKSKIWQSIAANVLKIPVKIPANGEAAALGGAIQALWAAGKSGITTEKPLDSLCEEHVGMTGAPIEGDEHMMKEYDAAYGEYEKYLAALSPLYT